MRHGSVHHNNHEPMPCFFLCRHPKSLLFYLFDEEKKVVKVIAHYT